MINIDPPIDLISQINLMRKYIFFSRKNKIEKLLKYAGYFRISRYAKYLLSKANILGGKSDIKLLIDLYNFDTELRILLFKYCKKAEIFFKSNLSNAISIKTNNSNFYLDSQYYTPTKSEADKLTRQKNIVFFQKFFKELKDEERKIRSNTNKYPELKKYRSKVNKGKNSLPVWVAFSYYEFGTIVLIYSFLRGDLRKEVLSYMTGKKRYGKESTKCVDTWLDAIRNLRNYCAHHSMLIGMTSSIIIIDKNDDRNILSNSTDLFSRIYALKKLLPKDDVVAIKEDLSKLINKSKLDVFKMGIFPKDWIEIFDNISFL